MSSDLHYPPQVYHHDSREIISGANISSDLCYQGSPPNPRHIFDTSISDMGCSYPRNIEYQCAYAIFLTVIAMTGPALLSTTQDSQATYCNVSRATSVMLFSALGTSLLGLRVLFDVRPKNLGVQGDNESACSSSAESGWRSPSAVSRILHPIVLKHISLFLLLGGVLMSMYSTQGSAATLASFSILVTMFSFYLVVFLRREKSRRLL